MRSRRPLKPRGKIFYKVMSLCLIFVALAFTHEKTGWIAPESAKKMKNPIRAQKPLSREEKKSVKRNALSAMVTREMEKVRFRQD